MTKKTGRTDWLGRCVPLVAPAFRRGRLALQAFAHEFLALVAFEFLVAGVFVAGFHLVLLRFLLVGRSGVFTREAGAHEFLALVAFLVGRLFVAVFHALLLRLLLLGRLFLCFLGRR